MLKKILVLLVLIILVSTKYLPRKICKTISYTKRVPVIKRYQITYKDHSLAVRYKYVYRRICKRKRVQETITVPKIVKRKQTVYKKMLRRKPVKVVVPYLTYKSTTEYKYERVKYHKYVKVPLIVKVKKTRRMSRRVFVKGKCYRTGIKEKKIYGRRPYRTVCNIKGKKKKN